MSCVYLIAADRPLPLCDRQEERTSCAGGVSVSFWQGFQVTEHSYYRGAVERLGLTLKPFQYELAMEAHEKDLAELKAYLTEHLAAGETVELWNIWVGDDRDERIPHFRGRLAEFDMDTLKQFLRPSAKWGEIGQCRMSIIV